MRRKKIYHNCYNYSDAVHHADDLVLMDQSAKRTQRIERLFELLYSLAETIPDAWGTTSRATLTRREESIERIVRSLSTDLAEHAEYEHFVLGSVLSVALTIRQLIAFGADRDSQAVENRAVVH